LFAAHWVSFGLHATQVAGGSSRQTGVEAEQVVWVCHAPATHCWSASPRHLVWLGAQTPEQMPPTHVIAPHDMGIPHCPVVSQCWTASLPAHWLVPGVHEPVHAAVLPIIVHTELVQGVVAPHMPVASQFCTPLALHWVSSGAHEPVHVAPMHVWCKQGTREPQAPVSSQVCTPLFRQRVSFGLQATQLPSRHTPIEPVHVVCVDQLPLPSQVWMDGPRHRVCPGPHCPVQVPCTQVLSAGQGLEGRRHCTQAFVDGSQTPPAPVHAAGQVASASEPPSIPPPVLPVPAVPAPPVSKPPYVGKPHAEKTTNRAAKTRHLAKRPAPQELMSSPRPAGHNTPSTLDLVHALRH
jgi:hypothetical protein